MGTHTYTTKDGKKHEFIGTLADAEADMLLKEAAVKTDKEQYAALLTDSEKLDFIAKKQGLK